MIIFGTGSANLETIQASNEVCEHCNQEDSIFFSYYRRHVHIFWIPVFPLAKTGCSYCSHCKQRLAPKQMSRGLKTKFENTKQQVNDPLWQFTGTIILVFLIGITGYTSSRSEKNIVSYLDDPSVGDIYEYRSESGNYSTMMLKHISPDSLYMSLNFYEIPKASRLYNIDKHKNYRKEVYAFSKEEIKSMKNSGTIFNINRP